MSFHVIVVGGGPAGLSAALMLGRCRRRVLVCDLREPRNQRASALHGYLTRDGIPPAEFHALGCAELEQYEIEQRHIGVESAVPVPAGFEVRLANGKVEHCQFLLLATGVVDELPCIPGLRECYGRSVFHCPYCDGWEWRDRALAVLGRGLHGVGLALAMKTWSSDVLLCTHASRLPARARTRLEANDIAVRRETVERIEHDNGALRRVVFASGAAVTRDALFFSTGQYPRGHLAVNLGCEFTRKGTVKTGLLSNTNTPGVFVAGDVSHDAQFVVVAAAEGVKAALAINQALQQRELAP